jgi:FKBP-type peptidyl-prolyl cis-trans isomerase
MSVTAVPLRPIARGALGWLWLGLAVLALVGIGAALYGTRNIAAPARIFLARNAQQPGVVVTPSGLQYKVLAAGRGPHPTTSDVVLISYVARLADGTLVDRGGPVPMSVSGTVPGFSEALTLMPVGSRYRVWIPPALGYPEGRGPIPPNSLLIFDLDLLAVAPHDAAAPPPGLPPQ